MSDNGASLSQAYEAQRAAMGARAHFTRLEALERATVASVQLSDQAGRAADRDLAKRASELGLLIATEWHKVVEGDK